MGSAHTKGRSFEQDIGKFLLHNDGECEKFAEMTTSTGRIGQQTNLGVDIISDNIAGECKRRDSLPNWFQDAWDQIQNRADDLGKAPVLAMKADYKDEMFIIDKQTFRKLLELLNE